MIPLVVVELGGPGAVESRSDAMLAACTAALRQGACVLDSPGSPPERAPDAVAEVTASSELSFEIRVTRRAGAGAGTFGVRSLEFRAVDAPEERWRSVGIAIASTAGELGLFADEPVRVPAQRPASRSEPKDERPVHVAAGMISGTGMEAERIRLGGFIEGSFQFGPRGPYALAFARYATGPAGDAQGANGTVELGASFVTTGLGVGFSPLTVGGVGLRTHVAGMLERLRASAFDASGGVVATDERWVPGALAAAEASFPDTGAIGAVLGGELGGVAGATVLNVEGAEVARNPSFRWGIFFGLEFRP